MIIFIVALSLSMDAFSLALIYGILNFPKKQEIIISSVVGIYHFIMPLFGNFIGSVILTLIPIKLNILVSFIFIFIGIQMLLDVIKKEETNVMLNLFEILLFGLAVSVDSFGTGLGLKYLTSHIIISSLTFSITSFVLTYIGIRFGKKIGKKIGDVSNIMGGIVLIILGLIYMFK